MADTKKSYLEMSDDDIMNIGPSEVESTAEAAASEQEDAAASGDSNADVDDAAAKNPDADASGDADDGTAGDDAADASKASGDGEEEPDAAGAEGAKAGDEGDDEAKAAEDAKKEKPVEGDAEKPGEKKPGEADAPEKQEPVVVDYKAEYDRITAPFKANGKDVQVKSADEAIALMQMGANYHKKMAGLKPHLKLLKMLEKNQLVSEEKLSFLIDLDKKNPEAINKLLKDSGVDPLQIDLEKAGDYKPNSYKVDDREMDLDTALDSIQDTPTYNRTLEILGTKWDGKSKQVIADTPQLVKVINDHVQSGIYDVIASEVERERMLGRLDGLSDIDAYRQVGDAIQARGGFKDLVQQAPKTPTAPVVVAPKPKTAQDDKLREKKRAAAPSTPSAPAKAAQEFNPLALSDDAFAKIVDERFK